MTHRQPFKHGGFGGGLSRRSFVGGLGAAALTLAGRRAHTAVATQGTQGQIAVMYEADSNEHFARVVQAFTDETGIGVDYETYPSEYLALQQLVTARLASGDVEPDCFWCDDIMAATYGAAGWLQELDSVVQENGIDLSDYPQTLLTDVSSWDGTLYRLPWDSTAELILYRTDYFAEAGAALPTTWDELVEAGKSLSGGDRFGIALNAQKNGALGNDIQHWTNQAGGSVLRLDDPGSRQALVFYKDLFATHKIAPPSAPQEDYDTNRQGFLDGRYAMWWTWSGVLGAMRSNQEFWKDQVSVMVPMPKGPSNAQTNIGCWGWSINNASAKKDLAAQWVAFTARPEVMKLLMFSGSGPARTSLWSDPEYQERAPQLPYLAQLAQAGDFLKARPITPSFQEIYDAAEQNVHAYLTGQVDVDGAIERAMDKIRPIVEREAS